MLKNKMTVLLLAAIATSPVYALDLKMPSVNKQASAPAAGNAIQMQEGVVKKYVEASGLLNKAQTEMLYAFGLKDKAAALEAQAKVLGSGATLDKDGIEKQKKLSEEANNAIQEKLDSNAQLDAEGKKHYANSLVPYSGAVSITSKLPNELSTFGNAAQSQIQSASMTEKLSVTNKLAAGMHLVKELPGYTGSLLGHLNKMVSYANKNQIPVPKDATAALGN
jgi:hypothetical protein